MVENTKIEWAHHTFNPWSGCQHVSPGCDHCYAEAQAKRNTSTFGGWGAGAQRKRTSESYWRQPLKWNSEARKAGTRPRVFCASMADVFDNQVPEAWRAELWTVIRDTPHLDWLLLTKRPQNIARMLPTLESGGPCGWGQGWPNVWLGTTVENQAEADRRIPHLLAVPAAKRFLSCEPLLGVVDLESAWHGETALDAECWGDCGWCSKGYPPLHNCRKGRQSEAEFDRGRSGIDWVICGGESGPGARPMHPDWARSLRDQCAAAGVPFFFKQWGEWRPPATEAEAYDTSRGRAGNPPAFIVSHDGCVHCYQIDPIVDGKVMLRVGKKAAGRLLDGVQHDGVPA